MKLKENYVLRQVLGSWVVLPIGAATVDFNGMLSLNDSGALLWKRLEQGADREDLADVLTAEYDVSRQQALADVDEFYDILVRAGCAEDLRS